MVRIVKTTVKGVKMQTPQNEVDSHDDDDKNEPFSVEIFSRRLRFSRPFLVQFIHHLYRWSIYIFIPFSIRLIPGIIAFTAIVNLMRSPLDATGIAAVFFIGLIGIVLPSILLMKWYRSIPWWFLNGTERCWQTFRFIAEANEHRFPDDFWHPFIYDEFGLEENTFAEELVVDSSTEIEGFIGCDINISYKYTKSLLLSSIEQFDLYFDSAYWQMEKYGLRFYGERVNVFIPYRAMQTVKKGLLFCNIILKFDTKMTFDPQIFGHWTEVCVSIGHLPTMRGDRMLRDELYRRITAAKTADLM